MIKYAEECVVLKQVYFWVYRGNIFVGPFVSSLRGVGVAADTGLLSDKAMAHRQVIIVAFSALKQHV